MMHTHGRSEDKNSFSNYDCVYNILTSVKIIYCTILYLHYKNCIKICLCIKFVLCVVYINVKCVADFNTLVLILQRNIAHITYGFYCFSCRFSCYTSSLASRKLFIRAHLICLLNALKYVRMGARLPKFYPIACNVCDRHFYALRLLFLTA